VWTNGSLTFLERSSVFATVVVSDEAARAYEAAHNGTPFAGADPVGQAGSEHWELEVEMGRVRGEARAAWIISPADGKLPLTPQIQAIMDAPFGFANPEERPGPERCLTDRAGPPILNGSYNNNFRIVQTPDHIVIQHEQLGETRIVHLSPTAPIAPPSWSGHSAGRWENDTLVVETTAFNAQQAERRHAAWRYYLSPSARVTERFTRTGRDSIAYEFSVDDPAVYTQVWRGEMPVRRMTLPIYEYGCHEGNYSLRYILAGGRRTEQAAR
jgi:hypothetical protein